MKPRYRRDGASPDPEPPAVQGPIIHVPHARILVDAAGVLTVTVDGEPFEAPAELSPLRREAFGALMDHLTGRVAGPVRIEVHEADGSTFTDIITPPRRRPRPVTAGREAAAPVAAVPSLVELSGEGYVPGEDVAVAVIVAHTDAACIGRARALLESHLLGLSPTGEAILFGRISGTVALCQPGRDEV